MPGRKIFLRAPDSLPSLESLFGWHSQYERMLRAHARLAGDRSLDALLTFFLNCYALRDWLVANKKVAGKAVDDQIGAALCMQLCRDICNRSKHLTLNRPSIDGNFVIAMEYRGESQSPGVGVLAGGVKSDLRGIADQCVSFWTTFLQMSGLLGSKPVVRS